MAEMKPRAYNKNRHYRKSFSTNIIAVLKSNRFDVPVNDNLFGKPLQLQHLPHSLTHPEVSVKC